MWTVAWIYGPSKPRTYAHLTDVLQALGEYADQPAADGQRVAQGGAGGLPVQVIVRGVGQVSQHHVNHRRVVGNQQRGGRGTERAQMLRGMPEPGLARIRRAAEPLAPARGDPELLGAPNLGD